MPEITVRLNFHDLWLGVYWFFTRSIESRYRRLDVYICFLPALPIRLRFEWGWKSTPRRVPRPVEETHYNASSAILIPYAEKATRCLCGAIHPWTRGELSYQCGCKRVYRKDRAP